MKRYPDGVEGEFFYEKNCPEYRPKWVQTAQVWSESNDRIMNYCLVQDLPTLVWAANLADLELHTSLSREDDMTCPTMMVFDLDPGAPAGIIQCCQVGLWLRDLLGKMKLKSFAKTSGSKGLQIYVPLNTSVTSSRQSKDSNKSCRRNGSDVIVKARITEMNNYVWFDAIGWAGAAALLVAYAMVSSKKLEGDSAAYQVLNVSGSLLLAANTIFYGSYPSTFVNLIWAGIAVFSIATRKRLSSR